MTLHVGIKADKVYKPSVSNICLYRKLITNSSEN